MYQSLFTNAMVSIVLGVLLPILYFVANHFIKEKKFLTVIVLIVSVLSIAVGLRNRYYAKKPSIKTIVAKYDGVHQFGEAFGSTWYFVDKSENTYSLSLDYFSIRNVIPNGELDPDKQYIVTFEEHTEVLVDIKEAA